MKIMIAYPPLIGKGSPMLTQNRQFQWYNMGSYIYPVVPAYAASLLTSRGYDVIFADYITQQKTPADFETLVRLEKPDLLTLETKTPVVRQHWKIIKKIKQLSPNTKVVLMGDHVTALPLESMSSSEVDFVITGGNYDFLLLNIAQYLNGEQTLEPGIYYRENGQVKNTGDFKLNHDLDSLPFIDRDATQAKLYGEKWRKKSPFFYTMFGRDCPWARCSFCSWTTTYPKFRSMSPSRALDEVGFLIRQYGAKEIFDDSGTFPGGKWLEQFCEGMINRGYHKQVLFSCNMRFDYLKNPNVPQMMKKAGFRKIKSGLESANQATLDKICKGTTVEQIVNGCKNASKAGLDVHLTVMVGYPFETREDAKQTISLAKDLMGSGFAEMLQATVVVPYPGTPLYDEARDNNWFTCDPNEYEKFDQRGSVLKTPDMTSSEIVEMCAAVYKSFFSPKYMAKQLFRNINDPKYLYRGFKSVLGHLKDFS